MENKKDNSTGRIFWPLSNNRNFENNIKAVCLYCNQEDGGLKNKYTPGNNVVYVCSMCVIILCEMDQAELKRELEIAIEKNLADKITALNMFIEPEEIINVRPSMESRNSIKKRLKRDNDRTGSNRPNRFKKELTGSTSQ